MKSSSVFGLNDEVTCGGNALKFHAAVRLKIMRRGLIDTEQEVAFLRKWCLVINLLLAYSSINNFYIFFPFPNYHLCVGGRWPYSILDVVVYK